MTLTKEKLMDIVNRAFNAGEIESQITERKSKNATLQILENFKFQERNNEENTSSTTTVFKTLKNPMVRLWHSKDRVIYKVEIRHPEYQAYLNPAPEEYVRLQEIEKKLDQILVYVRILQDGDPENENPGEILDEINKILERKNA